MQLKLQIELLLMLLAIVLAAFCLFIINISQVHKPELILKEVSGRNHIFWEDKQLSKGNYAQITPVSDGDYAAWVSESPFGWQIWYAHLPSSSKIELFRLGNNVNPHIKGNNLVWEGQVNGVWQIMWFDGSQIKQVSEGDLPKQKPQLIDGKIVYQELDSLGKPSAKEYVI